MMEESKSQTGMLEPGCVELSLASSGDTYLVTRGSVGAVHTLSPRLDDALRLGENTADSVACSATGTNPDSVVRAQISAAVDERLFWSMIVELSRSQNYRTLCLNKFRSKCQKCHCTERLRSYPLTVSVVVLLVPWNPVMDMSWEAKIIHLVVEQLELENTMAWLSTLGGAFSALGDYCSRFAEAAGLVSVKQLKLALRFGDPVTMCRCHIYLAMSLLQRGYFRSCRRILRQQYHFATSKEGLRDPKLMKMCQSVWIRMRYLQSLKDKQPQLETAAP
ncbi:uncharacterized protein F58A4.6-like isoform X1 [Dermacentor andersoni]|uniref:uncharacterized protein F58A4.6-like isoform X1 n=1 Tax=Dermacentor andersoni TaxID=34620 RepID=UPI0021550555|nr:uncharacterized protein F58A4.6-like isoform X1 [Dermacentor andersoni]